MAAVMTDTSRPQAPNSHALQSGGYDYSVGTSIPANMPHAVSVSLPRWQDNVDYEEGRLTEVMQIGYPRFFIHKSIQKLAAVVLKKFGTPGMPGQEAESCLLCPSTRVADRCRSFMRSQHAKAQSDQQQQQQQQSTTPALPVRVVQFSLVSPKAADAVEGQEQTLSSAPVHLYIVLFPASAFPLAKSFWQHTGDGISSRLAEHCLNILEEMGRLGEDTPPGSGTRTPRTRSTSHRGTGDDAGVNSSTPLQPDQLTSGPPTPSVATAGEPVHRRYSKNRHYSRGGAANSVATPVHSSTPAPLASLPALRAIQDAADPDAEMVSGDMSTYVEERYGRNLPASSAALAKCALKRRIAGTLLSDRKPPPNPTPEGTQSSEYPVGATAREGTFLSEDDVYLFPSGMSSIFHAHQTALRWRRLQSVDAGKSVCFGFPYTDTLKILQKWGPGCHFYGNGLDCDLDDLEALLKSQRNNATASSAAPILSLFCEFPSNPLLRCPDLARIRRLADDYDFLVVVDETIGNFLNVEVLPYADLVVSSLTKVFSGDANVMGGSMVINPRGRHVDLLRRALNDEYEDTYWGIDSVFMERNSRDFASRVEKIDRNAEALADMLVLEQEQQQQQRQGGAEGTDLIKGVYYPKYTTREKYDQCRRRRALLNNASQGAEGGGAVAGGGFGGLFSIIFNDMRTAETFYDALRCAKGPSLGTNFTLASPYTLLAHYTELDWARQYGVEATLVRISTGLEDTQELVQMFRTALDAARSVTA